MHMPPSPSSLVAQKEAAHEAACHPGRALDGWHGIFYRVFYSVHGEEVVWTEYSVRAQDNCTWYRVRGVWCVVFVAVGRQTLDVACYVTGIPY